MVACTSAMPSSFDELPAQQVGVFVRDRLEIGERAVRGAGVAADEDEVLADVVEPFIELLPPRPRPTPWR